LSEITTSRRLPALDLARIIAMIMMIQGHTIFALAHPQEINYTEFFWEFWNMIRGLTAPVFLMVSGAVQVFANKRYENGRMKPDIIKKRIQNSIMLFFIGYVLVFPASTIYDLFFINSELWQIFFQVNILQLFATLLLLMVVLMYVTRTDNSLMVTSLILAISISFISPMLRDIDFRNLPMFFSAMLNFKTGSLFPLFPFAAYFFYGVAFGVILKKIEHDNITYFLLKYGVLIGLAFWIIAFPFAKYYHSFLGMVNSMSTSGPGLIFYRMGAVMIWLSFSSAIYLLTKKYEKLYINLGKRSLYIYVVHLLILYSSKSIPILNIYFEHKSMTLPNVLLAVLVVESLSLGLTYLYDISNKKYPNIMTLYKYVLTAYMIYFFFL